MPPRIFMSSGDMVADRRFDYARDFQLRGDLEAAADLLLQAIELAPGFASAWFTLGDVRETLGDTEGAVAAFRCARDTDPSDAHGAALRLMRLGAGELAPMPVAYLTALYEQYAPKFEASLLGELGYRAPDLLFKAVLAVRRADRKPAFFKRAVDVGCGTGLAARAFAKQVDEIVGIDLSPGMVQQARATGLYKELDVADAVEGLHKRPDASAELILAADMMIYIHDLAPLMHEAARVLAPGGLFAFSTETHDGEGVVLGAGLRYAQSEGHLRGLLADAGLKPVHVERTSTRTERDVPVPSLVIVAAKP